MERNFLFEFCVPSETQSRFIEAKDLKTAEILANHACEGHSFLGGAVRPPVKLVGEVLPKLQGENNRYILLPSGRMIEDHF